MWVCHLIRLRSREILELGLTPSPGLAEISLRGDLDLRRQQPEHRNDPDQRKIGLCLSVAECGACGIEGCMLGDATEGLPLMGCLRVSFRRTMTSERVCERNA
jgi:hypothetical protein